MSQDLPAIPVFQTLPTDAARAIAKECAATSDKPYTKLPDFQPHDWVIEAVQRGHAQAGYSMLAVMGQKADGHPKPVQELEDIASESVDASGARDEALYRLLTSIVAACPPTDTTGIRYMASVGINTYWWHEEGKGPIPCLGEMDEKAKRQGLFPVSPPSPATSREKT